MIRYGLLDLQCHPLVLICELWKEAPTWETAILVIVF